MLQGDFGIDLEEFRELFIDESLRHLQTLNSGVLTLEQTPDDAATLADVFRAAHTLKGMAATMGYHGITRVAHGLEDVLDHARTRPATLTPSLIALLFSTIDALEALVKDVVSGGGADLDVTATLAGIRAHVIFEQPPAGSEPFQPAEVDALTLEESDAFEASPSLTAHSAQREDSQFPARGKAKGGEVSVEDLHVVEDEVPKTAVGSQKGGVDSLPASHIVRLDVQHLDRLLDIVTEMVIHRSALTRLYGLGDLPALGEALAVQHRLVDRLQDAVLETRMVPVSQVFDRFPRMVRDLLKAQGKEAQLVIEGAQVELDRTTLASVGDALVHLLRNAIDHGLESPEERVALGKARRGTVWLSASYERNTVVIEVRDDGWGMDAGQIGRVAVDRGVVSPTALAEMNEGQVLALVCAPRFSLSSQVTEVSGRGVGMDAVKRQIELMRGSLEIESRLGEGSTFRLHLPSNLALLDALLVVVGETWYAVPAAHIETIIEVDPADLVTVGGKAVLSRPHGLLPVRSACEVLGGDACARFSPYVLAMQQHGRSLGVGVDKVVCYEQIVAKPLPPALEAISVLSGVTILDQGRVAFIVDLVRG